VGNPDRSPVAIACTVPAIAKTATSTTNTTTERRVRHCLGVGHRRPPAMGEKVTGRPEERGR